MEVSSYQEVLSVSVPIWSVSAVEPRRDYSMLLTFANGEKRLYDARPLLDKKLCARLKDVNFFMRARAMYGTVVWNDDVDIAPEHLYEYSVPVGSV